jgi:hypothetical protein
MENDVRKKYDSLVGMRLEAENALAAAKQTHANDLAKIERAMLENQARCQHPQVKTSAGIRNRSECPDCGWFEEF